ncbi:TIGR03943 family putative permease subunit [Streptomyces cinerochromogenes]|uniref:TIGR03943 family putative permease subunit n=1 Tax=Streptomyces cinerochromogenes TaxID=66422 RepID=UPI00167148CC|nr:TIGR03943 family protein [Streptomyces cinerochromogenes]GGS76176.1 TIGR03943 family protein [Streptomyces cinerochromogenes]
MKRPVQTLLLALTGAGLLHTALFTDIYLRYVKAGLRPLLIASGVVLLLLGLAAAVTRRPAPEDPEDAHGHDHVGDAHGHDHVGDAHGHDQVRDAHGHDHSGAPRIAWLLFLPALSLLLHAPPALGAYTAARSNDKPVAVQKGFAPLPATSPLPLTLTDFTKRVQQDRGRAIKNRAVRLTGFVTPAGEDGGWYLTRIIFSCCAADSQTVKVRVYGSEAPPADTWLAVTGTWHPRGTLGTRTAEAALDVRDARPVAPPVNAYTDDLPLTPS